MKEDTPAKKADWAPNEAPLGRWIGFFVAGFACLALVQEISGAVLAFWEMDGSWTWLPGTLCTLLAFSLTFALLGVLSKKIVRTSLRDLILGTGNTFDKGLCVKMVAAIALGSALNYAVCALAFPDPDATLQLNPIGAVPILVNLVLCIALLWMQTTTEEILFRCPFLRAASGDKIASSVKVAIAGVLSCFLFMMFHGGNPEVTSQANRLLIFMALGSYLIVAVGMYVADVVYGNCLASCVIHWTNNFVSIALFCQAGTAVESGSIFWITGAVSAPAGLVGAICTFAPVVVVMIVDARKRRLQA